MGGVHPLIFLADIGGWVFLSGSFLKIGKGLIGVWISRTNFSDKTHFQLLSEGSHEFVGNSHIVN